MAESPDQIIIRHLARYLGPSTAKTALKSFCEKSVGKPAEQLTGSDAPKVMSALRPMLRTLLGVGESDKVIRLLSQELGS